MNELKHTPGPWEAVPFPPRDEDPAGTVTTWDVYPADEGDEMLAHRLLNEADARLIAAAPDLLAACMVIDDIEDVDDVNRARHVARAALAKATKGDER